MQLLCFEGQSKRLPWAEEMALPNHFINGPWPDTLGQRRSGLSRKEVSHGMG
jgi:hypothetical protein